MASKEKYIYSMCEEFCEYFSFTRQSLILEGSDQSLHHIVKEIFMNRTNFYLKNENLFIGEFPHINEWVKEVVDNDEYWQNDERFINADDKNVSNDNFAVDILYTAGINPYEYTKNPFYRIFLESVQIFHISLVALVLYQ